MRALDRFIASPHDPRAAVAAVCGVAVGRFALERGWLAGLPAGAALPDPNLTTAVSLLVFYATCFWLFSAVLAALTRRPVGAVGNAAAAGLLFGLLPPLLELYLPLGPPMPYRWYAAFEPTLFADYQPRSEGLTLWLLFAATAAWVGYVTRSAWRAAAAFAASWLVIQLITAVVLAAAFGGGALRAELALAALAWAALRWRAVAPSLGRLNHGLPHAALALCGGAWVGQVGAAAAERGAVMLACVFVLLVHNEHYDRREDTLGGRATSVDAGDVLWTTAFAALLLLSYADTEPMLAALGALFLLLGFAYHHPAARLKERFCLAYKVEGGWAACAFLAGAAAGGDFEGAHALAAAGLAAFGGGTLLSVPKDWKDVAADRAARIPTYYVTFTRWARGAGAGDGARDDAWVHRRVVAACTVALVSTPALLHVTGRVQALPAMALGALGLVPGALLLRVRSRRTAVETYLWALCLYLGGLAAALQPGLQAARAGSFEDTLGGGAGVRGGDAGGGAGPREAAGGGAGVGAGAGADRRGGASGERGASAEGAGRPGGGPGDTTGGAAPGSPASPAARLGDPALVASAGARRLGESLTDYGRVHTSAADGDAWEARPRSLAELVALVGAAYEARVAMRTRGAGHSMNGATLPRAGELLVRTDALTAVRFERAGTVTAGAGVRLYDLQAALRPLGWALPVINGGTPDGGGPSVGGFVSAGGFGGGSATRGGFWENVDAVTLVARGGQALAVERGEELFPWLFGAQGQLGIVAEARLDLVPAEPGGEPPYPTGRTLDLPASGAPAVARPLYWFTLFVPAEAEAAAVAALDAFQRAHADALAWRAPYRYPSRFRAVAPPLVFPGRVDFAAVGVWGEADPDAPGARERLRALDAELGALAARNGWHRYLQAELGAGPEAWRAALGEATYTQLARLKQTLDPDALFNRESVFEVR